MRTTWLAILALPALAVSGPLSALEASDTMAAWRSASVEVKTRLVTALLKRDGRDGGAADVVRCLDSASSVPGHADLPIGEIVKACEKDVGEPV